MIYSCYNPLQKATLVSAVDVYEEEESELLVSFNRKLSLKLIVQLRIIIDAFVSFRNKILILYFLYTPKYIEETNSAGISSVSSRVNNSECFFPDQSIFKRLTGEQSSSFAFQWNSAPNSVGKSFKSMMLHNDNDFQRNAPYQHCSVARLLRLQHCSNITMLCCAKNRPPYFL